MKTRVREVRPGMGSRRRVSGSPWVSTLSSRDCTQRLRSEERDHRVEVSRRWQPRFDGSDRLVDVRDGVSVLARGGRAQGRPGIGESDVALTVLEVVKAGMGEDGAGERGMVKAPATAQS